MSRNHKSQNYLAIQLVKGVPLAKVDTELEQNRQVQRQREREARILSARQAVKDHAQLAHVLSDEVWAEVDREIAHENLTEPVRGVEG